MKFKICQGDEAFYNRKETEPYGYREDKEKIERMRQAGQALEAELREKGELALDT